MPEKPAGLPGKVTPLSLTLPAKLSMQDWTHTLGLLGNMAQGVSFWIADALVYGEDAYGEIFAQSVDLVGINPKTAMNLMAVGRAIPASRRREALTFGHHQAVAILEPKEQDRWLDLTERGDQLPNGERKRWSVARLRAELKALGTGDGDTPAAVRTDSVPVIAEGREISVRWPQGLTRYVVERVRATGLEAVDLEVIARRV
jgi:hypothetical protein